MLGSPFFSTLFFSLPVSLPFSLGTLIDRKATDMTYFAGKVKGQIFKKYFYINLILKNLFFSVKAPSASAKTLEKKKSIPYKMLESYIAPFLLKFPVRLIVMLLFFAIFCLSISVAPRISVGLEQEISMPDDSHVLKYFHAMFDYLSIGPPVYFVVKDTGINYTNSETQERIRAGSDPYSLASQIFMASKTPERTYIAKPAASWIDDYIDWANSDKCCWEHRETGEFCPSSDPLVSRDCDQCNLKIKLNGSSIQGEMFEKYFDYFLRDNPSEDCAKAGHAAYGEGINYNKDPKTGLSFPTASYFMTYHTILKTSRDYTEAMEEARIVGDNITKTINTSK